MTAMKRAMGLGNVPEANEADVIAANVYLDSENSPKTELSVTRRDSEKPLAQVKMLGAGSNDFQGVLAISTVNSGTPGGPLVERMRIHTNGYLGIGTDNPKTPLHIPEQGLQIGISAQASDNFHIVSDLTGNARGLRLLNGNYGAGTHLLTVLANGNVGIGTTNPLCTLDVKGKAIKLGLEGNGGGQLFLTNNPNDNKIYLEAFNKTGDGSADELLLTGINSKNVPKLSLLADSTYIAGNVNVAGNIRSGTSQTVHKETAIIFSGLNGDVDKIYELRLFGRMLTWKANTNIRLGPNKIFDTSGFRNLTHRFYAIGNDAKSDLDIRNKGGFTLGFTDWNADGDIFVMARLYAATGKSRALESTHLYTNSDAGAAMELRGDHIGWWSDTKTNITSLVIDFNGGAFTGTALLTTVQP